MKSDNPVILALVDIDKNQYWLAEQIKRSRSHTNLVIHRRLESWVVRRKIAKVLGKPENELFPDRKHRNSAGLVPPRQPEGGL